MSAVLLPYPTHHRGLPVRPAPLLRVTPDGNRPMRVPLLLCLALAAAAPTPVPTVWGVPSPSGPGLGTQAPPGAAAIRDALSRRSSTEGGQVDSAPTRTRVAAGRLATVAHTGNQASVPRVDTSHASALTVCLPAMPSPITANRGQVSVDSVRAAAPAPVASPEPPACTVPLEAARSVQVCALLSAPVVRIAAEPGDAVRAGDTLVWLDDRELCLAMGRARLAYQDLAARLQRAVQLHAQGGLSTQDLETLRFQLETAQLRWEQTRLELSRATLQAPMAGVVSECAIQVGVLTHPGQVLLVVIDPEDLKATLYLPVEWLRCLRPGQIVRGRALSEPGVVVRGTIRRLGPGLDPSSGCAPVEVLFPRAGRRLRPGTLVQVQLGPE